MRKPKSYLIEKYFQGGKGTYMANMPWGMRMRQGYWEIQLEEWGEATNGGHSYGYRIYARRPTKRKPIPEGTKLLHFNPDFLEKGNERERGKQNV